MAIPYSRTVFAGVSWYSVLIVLGILTAILLLDREEKRLGLPKDTAVDLALVTVPCGIVGARLYYVLMSWQTYAADPLSALYVWEGGVAIYGAVIGGALGAAVYARRKKLSWLTLLDAVVPGVLLAQAIGRWGNYFNMEAYGPEIHNARFQFFPAGVLIPGPNGYTWHMATFFYESFWNLCGALALWGLRKNRRRPGSLLCWYLLIYGSGRFLIEQLREDSLYLGGFRISQMLSLALCGIAACVLLRRAFAANHGRFALALAAALMLGARWYALASPWAYAALMLGALACCAYLAASGPALRARGWLWLLALALADAAGLAFSVLPTPLLSFGGRAHGLLCSATLPFFVGFLAALPAVHEKKEGEACPRER